MEVDEDGSVSVNLRSDARGDVVADELEDAKGVTVDTVVKARIWRSTETVVYL